MGVAGTGIVGVGVGRRQLMSVRRWMVCKLAAQDLTCQLTQRVHQCLKVPRLLGREHISHDAAARVENSRFL